MRSQDIKVGELYKAGYGICAKVLETRVENTTWRGTTRRDGVKVEIQEPESRKGEIAVYASRDINSTWDKYQREVRERQAAQHYRETIVAERKAQTEAMESGLRSAGIAIDRISFAQWGNLDEGNFQVSLSIDSLQLQKIIEMISSPEAKQRVEQTEAKPAAETKSALEQVFG